MSEREQQTTCPPVEVGMLIRDNDFRTALGGNRVMRIHAFDEKGRAVLRHPDSRMGKMLETRIALDRIHTDGKPRKTGWSLVQ